MLTDGGVIDFVKKIQEFQRNPPPDLAAPYFIIPTRVSIDFDHYENDMTYLPNRWNVTRQEFVDMLYKNQSRKKNVITYLSELGLISTDLYGKITNGREISRWYISLEFCSSFKCPEISIIQSASSRYISSIDEVSPLLLSTECSDEVSPLSLSTDCSEAFSFETPCSGSSTRSNQDSLRFSDFSIEEIPSSSSEEASVTTDFSASKATLYRDFESALLRREYSTPDLKRLTNIFGRKAYGKEWVQFEKLKDELDQLKFRLEEMKVPYHMAEQLKDAVNLIHTHESESVNTRFLLDGIIAATVPDDGYSELKCADVLKYYGIFTEKRISKAYSNRISLKNGDLSRFTTLPSRQKRVDNVDDLMFSFVHDFCHDDDESRIDSNGKLVRCCKSDGTKDYEKKHAIRNWRHAGDLKQQFERFKNSPAYIKYQCELRKIAYWENKAEKEPLTFSKFKNYINRIPCLQDPTDASCIDEIKVAANESFESLRKFTIDCCGRRGCNTTTNDTSMTSPPPTKAASSETQSKSCPTCKDSGKICLIGLLSCKNSSLKDFENAILCPMISCPDLMLDSDKECPKMYRYQCCKFQCEECGLDRVSKYVLSDGAKKLTK